MPTVIDSLVVSLGLDTSKFDEGQQKAIDGLRQLEEGANKHIKPANAGVKDLLDTFKLMQGRLLAIGGLIASGLGFNRLIQDMTKLNAETGYLATQLGVSAKELASFESIGRAVGASAGEMAASFKYFKDQISDLQLGKGSPLAAFAQATHQRGQGPAVNLFDANGKSRSPDQIAVDLSAWYVAQQNRAVASRALENAGIPDGMIKALSLGPEKLQKQLEEMKKFAPTEEEINRFKALQEAFGRLLTVVEALERVIAGPFIEGLTRVLNKITDWLGKYADPNDPQNVRQKEQMNKPWLKLDGDSSRLGPVTRGWNWLKNKWNGTDGTAEGGAGAAPGSLGDRFGNWRSTPQGTVPGPGGAPGGRGGAGGPGGEGAAGVPGAPGGTMPTSGSLAEQRQRFADELRNNPQLRDKVMRIMANEQGRNPSGTQSVVESMMNRAIVRGTNLETQARWYGAQPGGYYAMGNMGRGALENEEHRAILNRGITNALAGGNLSNYATDNSSGGLAARERATGSFRYRQGYNGETFFAPGPAEPRLAQKWDDWHARTVAQEAAGRSTASPSIASGLPGWLPGTGASSPTRTEITVRPVGGGSSFNDLWSDRLGGLGARGALARGDQTTTNNTSTSATHIGEMNVTVPPGADPAAYGAGIRQELQRYDNVQQSNTGLQ